MTESNQDAYDRGEVAGGIAARLAGHDRHFEKINGSIEKSADALYQVQRELHELKLQAGARDAVAAAVKDTDQERRDQVETSWSRIVRLVSLVGWVVAACLAVALIVH